MKARRLLAVAGATALAIGTLAGCSTSNNGGGGDENTLSIGWNSIEKAAMDPVIEAFKEANPDVTVNVTYSNNEQYQATLRTQLQAGTAPDVFYVWPANGNPGAIEQIAPTGALADLSDEPWIERMSDAGKRYASVDDKIYMFSNYVGSFALMYNDDAMAGAGLTAPTTWTELLKFCDDANALGKVPYALGAQTIWVTQNVPFASVPTTVMKDDPNFDEEMAAGERTFAGSEGYVEAMTQYQTMLQNGCFNESPVGTSLEQQLGMLSSGEALGAPQITAVMNSLYAAAPDTVFSLTPFPATENPDDLFMSAGFSAGPAVNAKTTKMDLAKKFVAFMAEPEQNLTYMTEVGTGVPALDNPLFESDDPNMILLQKYLDEGRTAAYLDQLWPNAAIQQAMFTELQRLLSGEGSPQEVLEAMDAAYDG